MKRLVGIVVVLALLIGALSSHGKSSTSTTTASEPPSPTEVGSSTASSPTPRSHAKHGAQVSYAHCDQNISAGPHTTCAFAENVFRASAARVSDEGTDPANYTVHATSPATGREYSMSCQTSSETTECSGGKGARVRFPLDAAQVYSQPSTSQPESSPHEAESEDPTPEEPGTDVPSEEPECTNGTYVNAAGNTVCSPEESPTGPPAGATAECEDGTYSFSESRSGTCSHHGGVSKWL